MLRSRQTETKKLGDWLDSVSGIKGDDIIKKVNSYVYKLQ